MDDYPDILADLGKAFATFGKALQDAGTRMQVAAVRQRLKPEPSAPENAEPELADAMLRIHDIIGRKKGTKRQPAIRGLIPMSRATWYAGIKAGTFPQPVRFKNTTSVYWRASDIRDLIARQQVK